MASYVIGDLQGCFTSLEALLGRIKFKPRRDRLWFVGDLVNRGAHSLECLRFVRQHASAVVLGNHDLHLLAVAYAGAAQGKRDTLNAVLDAPDAEPLLKWLRQQPLLHVDGDVAMVHAGLLPSWSWARVQVLSREVGHELAGPNFVGLLKNMYGNEPNAWCDGLTGFARHRLVINAMTRMRILTERDQIEHKFKGEVAQMPTGCSPWFLRPSVRRRARLVVAGHWSALGLYQSPHFVGLDTGCVWGRQLSALRLEDRRVFQVESAEASTPDGWD